MSLNSPIKSISIHVLRVEDDLSVMLLLVMMCYFNPRPPCGGRRLVAVKFLVRVKFQSTSSVWRTTKRAIAITINMAISIHVLRVEDDRMTYTIGNCTVNFNPRPPCGGRQSRTALYQGRPGISIHVLRVEDDGGSYRNCRGPPNFNPRPPCGGRHC